MDKEAVEKFTREVIHWHVADHFDQDALLAYAYGTLIFQVRLWERNQEHVELPNRVQTVLRILQEHCGDRFPLRTAAKEVGCSVGYLHELIHVYLKTTPHTIVLKSRMHLARERLATTNLPVKQVADECGFANTAAFCHAFKSRVGLTPMDYRKKQTGP